jgi:hypothetical protein
MVSVLWKSNKEALARAGLLVRAHTFLVLGFAGVPAVMMWVQRAEVVVLFGELLHLHGMHKLATVSKQHGALLVLLVFCHLKPLHTAAFAALRCCGQCFRHVRLEAAGCFC